MCFYTHLYATESHVHVAFLACRIVGFVDAWPKLEKWFTKFGIFQRVDANTGQGKSYIHTLSLLTGCCVIQ